MFPERIDRDRDAVTLTRFARDRVDVFELYDLFGADADGVADVFEYVPQEPYESVKDARDQLADAEDAWDDGEEAQYAVRTPGGALAGYAGLVVEWERRAARVGVILAKPYWGEGYGGECVRALAELAFARLDLDVVAVGHEAGNERSQRMLERVVSDLGGQYDGVLRNWTPVGDDVLDQHRYTVTRDQYEDAA